MEATCTKQRVCMKSPPFLAKVSVWNFSHIHIWQKIQLAHFKKNGGELVHTGCHPSVKIKSFCIYLFFK